MGVNGRVAPRLWLFLILCVASLAYGEPPVPDTVAPFTFADPDGLELELESLTVRAAASGPLSLTEMEMVFRNPRDRRTEGRFSCVLPEDATISRLAKEIDGELMEGEVVERLRANRIYDDILNQMRDPALLEQDQGNRYSMRIFPIEPNASVRIIVSWSRLLRARDDERTLRVPLRGLSRIGRFSFVGHFSTPPVASIASSSLSGDIEEASISTTQVVSFDKEAWTPDRDLVFSWPADRSDSILRTGNQWIAVLHPDVPDAQRPGSSKPLVFLFDTSASSAEGLVHRIHAMQVLLESLGDRPVEFVAFDQDVAPLVSGMARDVARSLEHALLERGFLGATNVAAMLQHLAKMAGEDPDRTFIVVSDGAATIGETSSWKIASAAASVPKGVTVHALVLGSRRHDATLRTITEGRGRIVPIPFTREMEREAVAAGAKLLQPLGETLTLQSEDAEFVWPSRAEDLHAGDEIIVVARTGRGAHPRLQMIDASGESRNVEADVEVLPDRFSPLLEREVARGYLELLARRERDETVPALREAIIAEQVRVSVASRVVIPRTTLLVLETESDYARFGVERTALGRILTIGAGGIDYVDRSRPAIGAIRSVVRVGAVRGRVTTEGVPLPGVLVTVRSPAMLGTRAAVTDAQGVYTFPALPAGRYDIVMELEGMDPRRSTLTVSPGRTTTFEDAAMSLSAIAEAITVTSELAPSALQTTEVGASYSAEQIDELSVMGSLGGEAPAESTSPSSRSEAITVTAAAPAAIEAPAVQTTIANDGSIRPLPGSTGSDRQAATYVPSDQTVERWREPERKSLGSLTEAVDINPLDRNAWSTLGEQLALRGKWDRLAKLTRDWQQRDPLNPQVYELIGELALATNQPEKAARAFGSLVETSAANAELVQRAGMLLFRLGRLDLAESALRIARDSRPDRVNGWRHLALVVWQAGRHDEAATILEEALETKFSDRQLDVNRIMREELGYVLRDWMRVDPDRRSELERRAGTNGVNLQRRDALRITLAWDTDANDVDLHVIDPSGEEVYYEHQQAVSGLELYEDVTRGFGPEVVRTDHLFKGTYQIGVNYYEVGPMGVSRGIVVIIRDDDLDGKAVVQVVPFRLRPDGESVMKVANLKM